MKGKLFSSVSVGTEAASKKQYQINQFTAQNSHTKDSSCPSQDFHTSTFTLASPTTDSTEDSAVAQVRPQPLPPEDIDIL